MTKRLKMGISKQVHGPGIIDNIKYCEKHNCIHSQSDMCPHCRKEKKVLMEKIPVKNEKSMNHISKETLKRLKTKGEKPHGKRKTRSK